MVFILGIRVRSSRVSIRIIFIFVFCNILEKGLYIILLNIRVFVKIYINWCLKKYRLFLYFVVVFVYEVENNIIRFMYN